MRCSIVSIAALLVGLLASCDHRQTITVDSGPMLDGKVAPDTLQPDSGIMPDTLVPDTLVLGTIQVNQVDAVGTLQLIGPSSTTITTATYVNPSSGVGSYSLSSITPPAGYILDKVTDGAGATLTAPYAQLLTKGGATTYNVVYKPSPFTATVKDVHPGGIVVDGQTEILSVRYLVSGTSASNPLTTLTVANDIYGAFDKPEDTNAVKLVWVSCPNPSGSGTYQFYNGVLVNGKRVFTGMNCYSPTGKDLEVQVAFDTATISSGTFTLSGKKFRLGILDSTMSVTGQNKVNTFVLRKAKPVFVAVTQASTSMPTTNGDIYKFAVTAKGGDISFARFVFRVKPTGLNTISTDDIYDFDFRNSGGSVSGHHIWGWATSGVPAAVYLKGVAPGSGLQDACLSGPGVDDAIYIAVVTFDNELTISSGSTETFTLRASILGATTDDTLEVSLDPNDDSVEICCIASGYSNGNGFANTTQLRGLGVSKYDSLFDGITGPGDGDNEYFSDTTNNWQTGKSIVWSDRAGGDVPASGGTAYTTVHTYPTIAGSSISGAGYVTPNSGTADWTNGYKLKISTLPVFSFKK